MIKPVFKVRSGQRAFRQDCIDHRVCGFVTRRQYGKTTFAALLSLLWMIQWRGITVVFGSVKLDLGREINRKEAGILQSAARNLVETAAQAKAKLELYEAGKGRSIPTLNADDFAELYEAQRLEFRLYHSRNEYSRTKVVALTPDAVGETGYLILDEVGRVKNFRGVWEAVSPIISSQPEFRCILTTTPPPDDSHFSFELLAPPVGAELPVNPAGNKYRSELGIPVRRVSAWDAAADGVKLYDDDKGQPITPEESRRRSYDKEAWDRNYGCIFVLGGSSACSFLALNTAQQRGIGHCAFFNVTDDLEFDQAIAWLAAHLGNGPIGLGFDVATTTSGTSNPSSCAIAERSGNDFIVRAVINWKTWDPAVAEDRVERIVKTVAARKEGGRARRLRVDATNERYWCQGLRRKLAAQLPVDLIVASETIERPGEPEPITLKQYEGSVLVGVLDDNRLWLPPERYIRDDFRLVKKEKGAFVCEPDVDGKHGDTFDAVKKSIVALTDAAGHTGYEACGTAAEPGEREAFV